jgi:hypothetical protein
VPVEAEAIGFDGGVTLADGLEMEAVLNTASAHDAAMTAAKLRESLPDFPAIARDLEITTSSSIVSLALQVSPAQLAASLRVPQSEPAPITLPHASRSATLDAKAPAAQLPLAAQAPSRPAKPTGPQVIRIFGLDDGPREIVLPPPEN